MSFSIGSLTRLPLGMQGESNSRPIRIDVHEWLEDWPGAAVNLMVCRPGEEEYYPAQSKVENGILTWVPSRSDVLIAGKGIAQFILTDENDVELRSRVVETLIGQSIRGTEGEAPEPVEGWVHEVLQAANGIKVSADRAEEQAQTAWQYSANAATSAENAEKAKQAAINNADDAEAAASNAQTWAGRAEAFAGNAATSAGNAEAAAATSTQSAASAAGSEARAEEIVQEMTGGVGGLYIVSVSGGKSNRTQAEIFAAVNAGKTCIMVSTAGEVKTYYGRDNGRPAFVSYSPDASGIAERRKYVEADGSVTGKTFAPARTPNPAQLIFSGAVEAEYDGSGLVRVHIPAGGSGGSGGVLYVTATITEPESETRFKCSFDKTGTEVVAAVKAGQAVYCVMSLGEGQYTVIPLVEHDDLGNVTYLYSTPTVSVYVAHAGGNVTGKTGYVELTVNSVPNQAHYRVDAVITRQGDGTYGGAAIEPPVTYEGCKEAIRSGMVVSCEINSPNQGRYVLPLSEYTNDKVVFESCKAILTWNKDGTATWTDKTDAPAQPDDPELADAQVYYTADGEVFTTLDGAIFHVRKEME